MNQAAVAQQATQTWYRVLKWGFGILWIVAGLLKLQPGMFTSALAINVLGPNALNNQPKWLYTVMLHGAHLWYVGLPVTTALLAMWEIALGVALIASRGQWFRITLWLVVAWCLVVWIMAEGMGGILTGSPAFPEGSPGSTPFYAVGAILLLYPSWVRPTFHRWAGGFWAVAALVQALPYNWSASQVGGIFGDVSMNGAEPAALDRLNNVFITMGYHAPVMVNLVMVIVMAVLAWGYWTGKIPGPIWWLTIAWLAFLWVIPQAMATLFTGTGTDLGNAFPLALLLWAAKYMISRSSVTSNPLPSRVDLSPSG